METLEARYKVWSDTCFQAFMEGDVERQVSFWAENCTRTAIDAFGEHHVVHGLEQIRKLAEGWATAKDTRLLKNELLCASEERGIGNAEVRWKGKDRQEYACNFIYMLTLDEDGRCVSYIEWNVVRSRQSDLYY